MSMRAFQKSHLVTLNSQLMAFAVVLSMAIAAAGVLHLDIEDPGADAGRLAPAVTEGDAYTATKPVKPQVREVAATTKRLTTAPLEEAGLTLARTSGVQSVTGFGTVGATWNEDDAYAEDAIRFDVRTRKAGTWTDWQKLEYHDDHGPDKGEAASGRTLRLGTEPSVVGTVDDAQFRVFTRSGQAPAGLRWVLIDPGKDKVVKRSPAIDTADLAGTKQTETPRTAAEQKNAAAGISLSAMKVAPKPQIYSRAQWGADEHIREQGAPSYGTVKAGFVHHTVNANNYTAAQVPALLRSIYAYHVKARGWRDIGYNYLVDRFGKIWEGRYGGVDKAVVGAHTLGYNEVSFAMSAIGNYDIAQPPQVVIDAYAKLFAWKLSLYGIDAAATHVYVKNRYLAAINGHRDVGQTACPGRYLYAKIPQIRAMAAKIQKTGSTGSTPAPAPTPTPTPAPAPVMPATHMPVPTGDLPRRTSVVRGSWPDLVVREKSTDQVRVVPTGGVFGFADPVTSKGPWGSEFDTLVPAGDVTGDGKGDLVVRSRATKRLYVRAGDGTGKVTKLSHPSTAFASYRWINAAKDLDRDGHADLVVQKDDDVYLARGDGKGDFSAPTLLLSGWTGGPLVGVGDFDKDGRFDLAGLDATGKLTLLPGTPDGLGRPRVLGDTPAGTSAVLGGAELTGDGVLDLAVRDKAGNVTVLPGDGKGGLGHALTPFPVLSGVRTVRMGQLFGSKSGSAAQGLVGYDDAGLVVRGTNGRTNTGALMGTSTVKDAKALFSPGDWNGDGKADLVTRSEDGDSLWLRLGDGSGTFGKRTELVDGVAALTHFSAVGDVTGDGHPDLVGVSKSGQLKIYPGNGKTGLWPRIDAPASLRSYNQIGAGLWGASSAASRLSASDGSFVPYVLGQAAPQSIDERYDWVVGHGDATGDGRADLIVREKATGDLYLLPGSSSGGFGTPQFLAAGFGGYDLVG